MGLTDGLNDTRDLDAEDQEQSYLGVERVTKIYSDGTNEFVALEGVSLEAKLNEFLTIVGPSGCGKSTLLKCIAGLLDLDGGSIEIDGSRVDGPYSRAGLVFQDPALFDWRTAVKNIMLQAEIRRLPKEQCERRAYELLKLVGLEGFEEAYPDELSGGMRQRVAICRALLHDPPLLLMDEPFGALDALTREKLNLDLEKIWAESRKTVIFITHDIEEACFLADRVIVMTSRPGRIASEVTIDLPRPRTLKLKETPQFQEKVATIRHDLERMGIYDDD